MTEAVGVSMIITKRTLLMMFSSLIVLGIALAGSTGVQAKEYIVKPKNDIKLCSEGTMPEMTAVIPELGIYTVDTDDDFDRSEFDFVEENSEVELFDAYNYAATATRGEYSITGMNAMWNAGIYGKGIKIGVVDSGCNKHERLLGCLKDGESVVEGVTTTEDNIGHGTAVCGVIGASYKDNSFLGIARRADIIPIKFIDKDQNGDTVGGMTSDFAKAIVAAVDDFDCDIINVSSGSSDSETLRLAIDYVSEKGAIVVSSVGNSGNSKIYYPAGYENVIGVGSVSKSKSRSSFSNMNESVFLAAPGQSLTLLSGTSETKTDSGTSFSTPYVSGIIADIMSVKPDITVQDIKEILIETCEDLGSEGYDTSYGYGLVRADNIVDYILKDYTCFTTGVEQSETDGKYEIRFRLNDTSFVPAFLLAEYTDSALCNVVSDYTQPAEDSFMIRTDKSDADNGEFKYFVWKSLESLIPYQ